MFVQRASLFLILCGISIRPSTALPIVESGRISPASSRPACNSSFLVSGTSSDKVAHVENLPGHSIDDENPSILTSIPTFAPPGAIRKRRIISATDPPSGINIPNPSISLGTPSIPVARAYLLDKIRKKQRRKPEIEHMYPLPSAATDAVQPHRAPVPDSAVNSIKDAEQQNGLYLLDQLNNEAGANDGNSGALAKELNIAPGYTSGNSADRVNGAIQNLASAGSPNPSPPAYKDKLPTASEEKDRHSLSNSLGLLSHPHYKIEDYSKKKRNKPNDIGDGKNRTRKETKQDFHVPTIWTGDVSIDELEPWETKQLDELLALYEFMERHKGKPPPSSLSASFTSPTPGESIAPKSLGEVLGLVSHPSFMNKTHRGNRRDDIRSRVVQSADTASENQPPSLLSLHAPSERDNGSMTRRDDEIKYPDTLDISDEAYDEFRKMHPKYFGGGWKMERSQSGAPGVLEPGVLSNEASAHVQGPESKNFGDGWEKEGRVPPTFASGQRLNTRGFASPSWFAMLLSPSAFLEKRPVNRAHRPHKRGINQEMPNNENLWMPDKVSTPPETLLSAPNKRDLLSSETLHTRHAQRQDSTFKHQKTVAVEDKWAEFARCWEGWIKGCQDNLRNKSKRRAYSMPSESRGNSNSKAASVPSEKSANHGDVPLTDDWFESAFTKGWEGEGYSKRSADDRS